MTGYGNGNYDWPGERGLPPDPEPAARPHMTALEALRAISRPGPERWAWARPISWRGTGTAICFEAPSYWKLVPTRRGGQTATLPPSEELFGEWEVVEPVMVNTETPSCWRR